MPSSQLPVTLTAGNLPPNPCYSGANAEQQRLNAYVGATSASLPPGYTTVITSMTAPGPDQRTYIWCQVDSNNRILGFYTFSNGSWQTIAPATPYLNPGEIRMYDPALYTPVAPWYPMDGTVIGVANFQGTYIVGAGARTLNAAQIAAGDTATVFTQGTPGGAEQNFLTNITQIPAHLHASPDGVPFLLYGGSEVSVQGGSIGCTIDGATAKTGGVTNATTGVTSTNPFQVLPPYQPVHFMQWRPDLA